MLFVLKYWWHRPNPVTVHLYTLRGIPSREAALAALDKVKQSNGIGGYYVSKAVVVSQDGAEETVLDDGHLVEFTNYYLSEYAPQNYAEQAQ